MLVPCGGERLPARLVVRVLAARDLRHMNPDNETTDAFVEVQFATQLKLRQWTRVNVLSLIPSMSPIRLHHSEREFSLTQRLDLVITPFHCDERRMATDSHYENVAFGTVFKTEVFPKSTSPIWNSEEFVWETDEQQLFDSSIIFKVMGRWGTRYRLTGQIGRLFVDANMLVTKIRQHKTEPYSGVFFAWLPIYAMVPGHVGELNVEISLSLLTSGDSAQYVQILSARKVPEGFKVNSLCGVIGEVMIACDPQSEWFDYIRSIESSSEARQNIIQKNLRDLAKRIACKARSLGANAILGYNDFADIEGDATGRICFRSYGTAMSISEGIKQSAIERIPYPIVSLYTLPSFGFCGSSAVICARAVHVIDDDDDSAILRTKWWNELKAELFYQASGLECNLVVGYTEQLTVHRRVAVLSAMGTAVLIRPSTQPPNCALFHVSYSPKRMPFNAILSSCAICGEGLCPDIVVSNCPLPTGSLVVGQQYPLQVCVTRKLNITDNDEHLASDISRALPFLEHDLHNELIKEARLTNARGNAIFELRNTVVINEGILVASATAVLCKLRPLMRDEGGAEGTVASVALQRTSDSRRFSWGSVRDAMRFRNAFAASNSPSVHVRVLHFRNPAYGSSDSTCHRRRPMERVVDVFRKKASGRDEFARLLFERQLSLSVGVLSESIGVGAVANGLAGIHLANTGTPFVVTGEAKDRAYVTVSRYTGVLIGKAFRRDVKDIAGLDAFLHRNLEGALLMARQHAQAVGACGLSEFRIPSVDLCACPEDAHVLILVTADILLPASEECSS